VGLFLSVPRHVGDAPLRLCAGDAHRPVDSASRFHRRAGSQVGDDRPGDPVLPPHRALPASIAVPAGAQPGRASGSDQHPSALGSASRAASVLQHDRLHPDGRGDVLPHVPSAGRGTAATAAVHMRVASWAQYQRRLTAALVLVCGSLATVCPVGCSRATDPSDAITVTWTLDPAPPVTGAATVARLTIRDRDNRPVTGARLRLEGLMSHPGMAPVTAGVV